MAQDTVAADATIQVRDVVRQYANLGVGIESLTDDDDLFKAGMTSYANVNVMLALEGIFGIEFPEELLRRSTFASVAAMCQAVSQLVGEQREP